MNREQIEKWAREASQWAMRHCGESWAYEREFARLARNAALEEAKAAILATQEYQKKIFIPVTAFVDTIDALKEPQP